MAATIRDVAAHCGLSIATVSKAFRGYADVSQATRERVQQAARELGYYPNAVARSLQGSRAYLLGVVLSGGGRLQGSWLSGLLDGFRKAAAARGYDVILLQGNPGGMGMTYLEQCRWRRLDGVCLIDADFMSPEVAALAADELPCVTVEHAFSNRSCVQAEHAAGMQALVEYAAAMGHRRIACVHGQRCAVTENRLLGFHRGMQEQGLDDDLLVEARYDDPTSGYEAVMGLMRQKQPPSCILMPDDTGCLGAFRAAETLGLSIPKDVSVAGFGGMPAFQQLHPRLTTIALDAEAMGCRAAGLLLERIEHPQTAGSRIDVMPVQLLPGETIGMLSIHP